MDIMDNIINQMKSYRVWIQICMQEEKKNIKEKAKKEKHENIWKRKGSILIKKTSYLPFHNFNFRTIFL